MCVSCYDSTVNTEQRSFADLRNGTSAAYCQNLFPFLNRTEMLLIKGYLSLVFFSPDSYQRPEYNLDLIVFGSPQNTLSKERVNLIYPLCCNRIEGAACERVGLWLSHSQLSLPFPWPIPPLEKSKFSRFWSPREAKEQCL